jgi:MoaA/NifB/PqqE/SkfB family radical SAM enzyme
MADIYNMEGHKLYWHLDRVKDWIDGKRIAPLYIDMGITQTCNVACKYCYYATPEHRTNKTIPTDALIRFLKDAAEIGVKAIGFLGDGEPMIHPGVYEAVIEGSKAGLDMAISTNGLVMDHNKLKDFLEALTWIRFNISAAEPDKYEIVMGTPKRNFFKVVDNIKKCIELKKQHNMKVTIGLQMVLISECVDQIVPFAKLGKELGVDYVVIKQCSESGGVKQKLVIDDYDKYEHLMKEAESCSNKNYNVIIKRIKMEHKKRGYDHCYGCEFLPQISGNGDVYCCGNFFGNKEFLAGNIINESFKDMVFGEKYRKVMEKVKNEVNVHKSCGFKCRQNEINEFLWKLKNPPEHVNFV